MVEAYVRSDSRGQWFIIAEGEMDNAQVSGEWMKTQEPVEVQP